MYISKTIYLAQLKELRLSSRIYRTSCKLQQTEPNSYALEFSRHQTPLYKRVPVNNNLVCQPTSQPTNSTSCIFGIFIYLYIYIYKLARKQRPEFSSWITIRRPWNHTDMFNFAQAADQKQQWPPMVATAAAAAANEEIQDSNAHRWPS